MLQWRYSCSRVVVSRTALCFCLAIPPADVWLLFSTPPLPFQTKPIVSVCSHRKFRYDSPIISIESHLFSIFSSELMITITSDANAAVRQTRILFYSLSGQVADALGGFSVLGWTV
jgi:hypothetical protein